jgi:hypothetical protein
MIFHSYVKLPEGIIDVNWCEIMWNVCEIQVDYVVVTEPERLRWNVGH